MTAVSYDDQTDIFHPDRFHYPVHLIGLGGIGSALALPLVKLGIKTELHLWDDDIVEEHNPPCQMLYSLKDVGRLKVEVAAELLSAFCEPSLKIVTHDLRVGGRTDGLNGVVISGVDSMESRAAIWKCVDTNPEVPLYMDGRIGGEQTLLFTLDPCDVDNVDKYLGWLEPDSGAAPLPCAARTVIHPPLLLTSRILTQFTRFTRGLPTNFMVEDHVRESLTNVF